MVQELGVIVGQRILRCSRGAKKRLTVRLGTPRKTGSVEWGCPYQIVGLDGSRVEIAYGIDAIQALQLALAAIHIRFEGRSDCTWKGGDEGDAGFPRSVPYAFGRDFAARVERHIDAEIARMHGAAQRRMARMHASRQKAAKAKRTRLG